MRILLAGGGSGGHVTPLRAVARAIQQKYSESLEITIVSDRNFFSQTQFLFADDANIALKKIYSGKFRRYHGKSFLWHVTHFPTMLKNMRDLFLIGVGVIQSINHFIWHKPDVVFCKGGYVCVPLGVACRIFNVPLIIHDSDTHPGLTNRFLARWAQKIATGMPPQYYHYPKAKMIYTGIPVSPEFTPLSKAQQKEAKKKLGIAPDSPLLLATGGGTGAKVLNTAVLEAAQTLLDMDWHLIQLTGKNKSSTAIAARKTLPTAQAKRWQIEEFAEVAPLVQAADIIVTRAGATAMQEFANAHKAVIIVPSPYLTGGHQLKNAAMFAEASAAVVLQEDRLQDPHLLAKTITSLQQDQARAQATAERLYKEFAKPNAAERLAELIVQAGASS